MKTIKEIADELGVSKQQIYRYVKQNRIDEAHQRSGAMYYDEAAETVIKKGFSKKTTASNETVEAHHDAVVEAVIDTLRQELKSKDDLLTAQQKTISELTSMLAFTQEALQTAQALHAGTIQKQLTDGQKKQGFIDRLFGRKGAGE